MSGLSGNDVAHACIAITKAVSKWTAQPEPLQAIIIGRAGVFVWRHCINSWAAEHDRSKLFGTDDLWHSLYNYRHLVQRYDLPSDLEIEVIVVGWQENVQRGVDKDLQKQFLDKVFQNHERPRANNISCRVTILHPQDPVVTASRLVITPTTKSSQAEHVLTAEPSVLLANLFSRLAYRHIHEIDPHQNHRQTVRPEKLVDSWREIELLYRLQESVRAHLKKNYLLESFLSDEDAAAKGFVSCLDNNDYYAIQRWRHDWRQSHAHSEEPQIKLYLSILDYFGVYFEAPRLPITVPEAASLHEPEPLHETDASSSHTEAEDKPYFPWFPPTPGTVQARVYSPASVSAAQSPPRKGKGKGKDRLARVFKRFGGSS